MSGWTHTQCITCWKMANGNREPVRVKQEDEANKVIEICCFCGQSTTAIGTLDATIDILDPEMKQ